MSGTIVVNKGDQSPLFIFHPGMPAQHSVLFREQLGRTTNAFIGHSVAGDILIPVCRERRATVHPQTPTRAKNSIRDAMCHEFSAAVACFHQQHFAAGCVLFTNSTLFIMVCR